MMELYILWGKDLIIFNVMSFTSKYLIFATEDLKIVYTREKYE